MLHSVTQMIPTWKSGLYQLKRRYIHHELINMMLCEMRYLEVPIQITYSTWLTTQSIQSVRLILLICMISDTTSLHTLVCLN